MFGIRKGRIRRFPARVGRHGRAQADVRRNVDVLVMADESVYTPQDALNLVKAEAADVLSVYVGKGGIAQAQKTAAIAEALLQSRAGEISLLPALPPSWSTGSLRGLRARGGFEVDIAWRDGKLTETTVRSLKGGTTRLRYGSAEHDVKLATGETHRWTGQ